MNQKICYTLLAGTMLTMIADAPSSMAADNRSAQGTIILAQAAVNPNDPQQKGKGPPPKGQPPAGVQRPAAPPKGAQQQPPPGQQRPVAVPKGALAPQPPQQRAQPPAPPKGNQPARVQPPGQPKINQPAQAQPPGPAPRQFGQPPGLPKGQPGHAQQPGLPKGAPVQTHQTPPAPPPPGVQGVRPGPGGIVRPPPSPQHPPQGAAAITPQHGRIDQLRTNRVERKEAGGRIVIQEPGGRVIVRDNGRAFIRHDDTVRFRAVGGAPRFEQRGRERFAYIARPGGYQIITVTGPDGRVLRRIRRGPDGREVVLFSNAVVGAAVATGFILALAAPQILIPRERYIVDVAAAPPALIYETLDAPPVVPIERAYALDEIRYNVNLRDRVRRLDLDAITFDTGSWELMPEQFPRLEVIANGIRQVLARNPNAVFMIEGHTDAVGADVDNLSLSDRRAELVAVVLTEQFQIPPENSGQPGIWRAIPQNTDRWPKPRESPGRGPQHLAPARRQIAAGRRMRARPAIGRARSFLFAVIVSTISPS